MTKTQLIKLLLLVLVGACIALFFVFDGSSYLNLSVIKAQQREYIGLFQQQPVLFVTAFALLYIAITALSLPIATLATLLAGAIFGLGYGLLLVSFASAIGATLAFLMARFIFKQPLQKKYAKQLASINAGFEKEGALYLFALRLVPLFPFFVVNLLMGLLPIKTRTYYIVSQIGMLPGTAVYVFAGTELGKISQLSDIASPQLWLAMTLLGLLPLLMKKLLPIIKGAINHG